MSESKQAQHTPGEWILKRGESLYSSSGGYGPRNLIVSLQFHSEMPREERDANARLIAAAPETARQRDELLEAAEAVVFAIKYERAQGALRHVAGWEQLEEDVRAAIARAKGGE